MASEYYDGYGGVEDFMPENQIDYGDLGTNVYLNKALEQAALIKHWRDVADAKSEFELYTELAKQKGKNALNAASQNLDNTIWGGVAKLGASAIGSIPIGGGGGGSEMFPLGKDFSAPGLGQTGINDYGDFTSLWR